MNDRDELSIRHPLGMAFAGWCAGVSAFQIALASGAPWGSAAWGGGHSGMLPDRLRLASGVAAFAFAGVAATAAGPLRRGRRWVLLGMGIYLGFGVVLNAMSPSVIERAIWVPLTALGSLLAFKAWREH